MYYHSQVIASLVPYQKPMMKGWPWKQSSKYCICEVQSVHIGFSRTHRNSFLSFCKTLYSMKLRMITENLLLAKLRKNCEASPCIRQRFAFPNIGLSKTDYSIPIQFVSMCRGFLTFPIENCKLVVYKWYITELRLWLRENSSLF